MTKLDRLDILSDSIRAKNIAEVCGLLQRGEARPVLVSVWAIDERTGRPVCGWRDSGGAQVMCTSGEA